MIRATVDTNILVSGLIVKIGKPAQVLQQARESKFTLILAREILDETWRALHYKHIQRKYHPSENDIEDFLGAIKSQSILVAIRQIENLISQDPPDNVVLACAVEGGADYLVSGNRHLLDLKQHRRVKIVTPAKFLEIINPKS